jgi:exo_poly_only: exopolyphosphatase
MERKRTRLATPIRPAGQDGAMPNYGVIDLGSNSIRLVVYEVKGNGPGDCAPKSF